MDELECGPGIDFYVNEEEATKTVDYYEAFGPGMDFVVADGNAMYAGYWTGSEWVPVSPVTREYLESNGNTLVKKGEVEMSCLGEWVMFKALE